MRYTIATDPGGRFVGAAGVRIGMTREAVHAALGQPERIFRKGAHPVDSEVYFDHELLLHYDGGQRLDAMELARSAEPVTPQGRSLFRCTARQIAEDYPGARLCGAALICPELGFVMDCQCMPARLPGSRADIGCCCVDYLLIHSKTHFQEEP